MFKILEYLPKVEKQKKTSDEVFHINRLCSVPRFARNTQITGKTTEIPELPKNNREILIGAY